MRINKKKLELAKARACMSTNDIIKAGVPKVTLASACKKEARPDTVGKIAKALGVDVIEILED